MNNQDFRTTFRPRARVTNFEAHSGDQYAFVGAFSVSAEDFDTGRAGYSRGPLRSSG
jgi:hypothetical protein